jgi:23S rRNA U2552 (ribose-2'-O)-methylase RlmE/FtsJ
MELSEFKYGPYKLYYPKVYYQFLKEVFIFDVYRSNLIRKNDIVLDLGATIGDFSVLASKKVGKKGKVIAIEPNIEDYKILKLNIKRNYCENVVPLNLGVGNKFGEEEITFWGKTFKCTINTLKNILNELNIQKIDFVKMDIEGFEIDVISNSIDIIKEANVISLECHSNKEKMDTILLPHGFSFKPVTYSYYYRKVLKNLFLHPSHICKVGVDTIIKNPIVLYRTLTRYDMTKERVVEGSYIKARTK